MKFSKVIHFLTFSCADEAAIEYRFNTEHAHLQSNSAYWSVEATKKKLKAAFWYDVVLKHYLSFCILSLVVFLILNPALWSHPLTIVNLSGLLTFVFVPMAAFIYYPTFYAAYVPLLDNYAEQYAGAQLSGIQKCKQQQYSVMALMLIQQVYNQISGVQPNPFADAYSMLMMKQYGISQKMVDATQRIIVLNQWDSSKERKRTEIQDAFEEAARYFESMEIVAATPILEGLRVRTLFRKKE